MTEEVRAKAFDPFFTTKDIGQGTGLGLSQVYGFAKQSRGHVKIYSEVGEGTTVKLYLPRFHFASKGEDEQVTPEALARGSKYETILVVEDDDDVRNYSCDTLRELGYTVTAAQNGQAGLKLLEVTPDVRVLFTDVGLPGGMNGRQLAEEARKHRPDLKVLFTTGYARNAIVHDGRLDPGVELITKPFTQAALAEKLREILDAKRFPGRVLLIEDEPLIQILAIEYLEHAGLKVDLAGSATEAMNKLALTAGGVDAVVVDLGLPDRKGELLIQEIRSIYPSLPLVVATGQGSAGRESVALGERNIEVVSKPYSAEDLLSALRNVGICID
jgi:CheY-like chemotaxis protein